MLRVPSNGLILSSSSSAFAAKETAHLRNSMSSDHSSTSTVNSSKNGDPTVASLGVRHSSPAVVGGVINTVVASSLIKRSNIYAEPSNAIGCNNFLTPSNNNQTALTTSSLSSGTGTTSPVSSSSPRLSTCSSTLALNENQVPLSTADRIIRELVDTETAYVRDLEDVIIGYIVPLRIERILPETDIECIFNNIEEIYYLNKRLLMRMQKAVDRSSGTPSLSIISRCFSDKTTCEKLVNTYRLYCASFAASSTRLESIQHNPNYASVTQHIRDLQVSLGHGLPLFAYLLKPVQRILKYQLLWQKLAEQFDVSTPEHAMAFDAAINMIHIAQLINSCISLPNTSSHNNNNNGPAISETTKASTWRASQNPAITMSAVFPMFASSVNLKHHGQEKVQADSESMKPSPSFVRVIVMQGQLQMRGAKHPRHVILFDSSLVVYKVHRMWRKSQEQEQLVHQVTIPASNLKLCKVPEKTSNMASFCVEALAEPKSSHIFQAESVEKKQKWCDAIRNVILNSSSPIAVQNSSSAKQRETLPFQMSTSVTVNMNNINRQQIPQPRRSVSPFVALEESSTSSRNSNSTVSTSNNTVTTIRALERHGHRRLGSSKSQDTALALPPPRFSSVGSSIVDSGSELGDATDRSSTKTGLSQKTTPRTNGRGSPAPWLENNAESHQTINRTDSEKWRERNRWKCSKSATIDRQYPREKHSPRNNESSSFFYQGQVEHQKMRGLLPWQNAPNRRAFVRRPSFVCASHLLRVAQQRRSSSSNNCYGTDNKTPTPASQETPVLPQDAYQHRYSRSNGLRRFFDAVAKRFRSSDRSSKSFVFTSGADMDHDTKQHSLPPLSTSLSAVTASELLPTQTTQTTPIPTRCQSPAPTEDTRPSTMELKMQRGGKTVDRMSGLTAAVAKQTSCSALLFTPRHSSLTNQQRQASGKIGFKKKSEARTAKIAHWAASGVPARDVFV